MAGGRQNGNATPSGSSATPARGTPGADTDGNNFSTGGTYSIEDVVVGSKIFVKKTDAVSGDIEERKAEILSIREKPKPRLPRGQAKANGEGAQDQQPSMEERLEYYVHYSEFNKRLDEWVSGTRLITSRDIEWPKAAATPSGSHTQGTQSARKKLSRTQSGTATPSTPGGPKGSSQNLLKKAALQAQASKAEPQRESDADGDTSMQDSTTESQPTTPGREGAAGEEEAVVAMEMLGEETEDGADETFDQDDVVALHPNKRPQVFSKEQEIEKLRTSGSMTQSVSEIARVKNLNKIQMGKHEVETWYFSPYPIEYAHLECLYICEMCLSYFPSAFMLKRHRSKCTMVHPPGNEIYRHQDVSFFEIDGRRQKVWCRNLCLLSKCFLDHKTLYYDVDPFLYYIMVQRDDAGAHIIGYFSKEKESAENYNVACILTLPQHQRTGFGRLLIEFSYELSKREHKLGSPEKPLSDLGLLSYRAYWAETIVELLLRTDEDISIEEIANRTSIVHADVLHTCQALNMLKQYQGKHYLVLNDQVLAKHEKQMKKKRRRIVSEHLNWQPPKFSRDQLRQLLY